MPATTDPHVEQYSRVDLHVRELDRPGTNPKLLSGEVAGTSEETARLFGSGRTMAEDSTGPRRDE